MGPGCRGKSPERERRWYDGHQGPVAAGIYCRLPLDGTRRSSRRPGPGCPPPYRRSPRWQQNPLPVHYLIKSAREVCRLFLHQPGGEKEGIKAALAAAPGQQQTVQAALLSLEPLPRVVVVWRDVAGFPVTELVPLVQQPVEDLYRILGQGRRELQKQLA